MACAKVWGCEGAPRGSGGLFTGLHKGMTQRDAGQVRARPRSGAEGSGESWEGFKQGQHSYSCVLERALWLPCGRWVRGDDSRQKTQGGGRGADSWRTLGTLPDEQRQAAEETRFRGKTPG